jgi:hypothetical protein
MHIYTLHTCIHTYIHTHIHIQGIVRFLEPALSDEDGGVRRQAHILVTFTYIHTQHTCIFTHYTHVYIYTYIHTYTGDCALP